MKNKKILGIISAIVLVVGIVSFGKIAKAVSPSPVSFGGTGVATITGIPYGTGTAPLGIVTMGSGVSFSGGTLTATGSGGTVTSVSGTSNRITSTGGATPVIDISGSYVGQSSITTLGTIGTGVWNGTAVAVANGGTACTSASITCFNNITGFTAIGTSGTTSTNLIFSGSPTLTTPVFLTSARTPLLIGGTGTTSTLSLKSTTGIGATGAIINFLVGNNGGTTAMTILNSGQIGVGAVTNPTSDFMLPAGTATAGTAPLKFTSGTNLTSPEDGAVEYNGTHLYVDIGSTRYQLDQQTAGANLIVGTSTISGGSSGNIEYNNGGVLGELTTTGSGTVAVLQTAPTFLTSATSPIFNATTGFQLSGAAASGKILVGNGTNFVASTPTFPNASATIGKIIKSDGTNWIASTETYATPGTSGNVMTSDGTNWTSAAPSASTVTVSAVATVPITVNQAVTSTYYQTDNGIQLDTNSTSSISSGTTVTKSFTVGVNSNRALIVNIVSNVAPSVVTYNGVSMTQVTTQATASSYIIYAYYLNAPATGANNLIVTLGSSGTAEITIASYYNVSQSGQPENTSKVGGSGNSATIAISTTSNGALVVALGGTSSGGSGGSGVTWTNAANNNVTIGGTTSPTSSIGDSGIIYPASQTFSVTYATTFGGSFTPGIINLSLAPVTAPSSGGVTPSSSATKTTGQNLYTAFMGFASNSVSAGGTEKVITNGVVTGLSSLTPNVDYFLNDGSGTIGTSAGTNSRKVGISLSTTSLLITNIW